MERYAKVENQSDVVAFSVEKSQLRREEALPSPRDDEKQSEGTEWFNSALIVKEATKRPIKRKASMEDGPTRKVEKKTPMRESRKMTPKSAPVAARTDVVEADGSVRRSRRGEVKLKWGAMFSEEKPVVVESSQAKKRVPKKPNFDIDSEDNEDRKKRVPKKPNFAIDSENHDDRKKRVPKKPNFAIDSEDDDKKRGQEKPKIDSEDDDAAPEKTSSSQTEDDILTNERLDQAEMVNDEQMQNGEHSDDAENRADLVESIPAPIAVLPPPSPHRSPSPPSLSNSEEEQDAENREVNEDDPIFDNDEEEEQHQYGNLKESSSSESETENVKPFVPFGVVTDLDLDTFLSQSERHFVGSTKVVKAEVKTYEVPTGQQRLQKDKNGRRKKGATDHSSRIDQVKMKAAQDAAASIQQKWSERVHLVYPFTHQEYNVLTMR